MGVRVTGVPGLTARACRQVPGWYAVGGSRCGSGKTAPGLHRQEGMTSNHGLLRPTCRGGGPPVDVVLWRRCRLLEAGFPDPLATRLANAAVDVHALLQLVDRGCPPGLAARILAPAGFRLEPVGSQTGTSA